MYFWNTHEWTFLACGIHIIRMFMIFVHLDLTKSQKFDIPQYPSWGTGHKCLWHDWILLLTAQYICCLYICERKPTGVTVFWCCLSWKTIPCSQEVYKERYKERKRQLGFVFFYLGLKVQKITINVMFPHFVCRFSQTF